MNWKLIDTAPKSGRIVLLCRFLHDERGFRWIGRGFWSKKQRAFVEPGDAKNESWYAPTHWCEPTPPEREEVP